MVAISKRPTNRCTARLQQRIIAPNQPFYFCFRPMRPEPVFFLRWHVQLELTFIEMARPLPDGRRETAVLERGRCRGAVHDVGDAEPLELVKRDRLRLSLYSHLQHNTPRRTVNHITCEGTHACMHARTPTHRESVAYIW